MSFASQCNKEAGLVIWMLIAVAWNIPHLDTIPPSAEDEPDFMPSYLDSKFSSGQQPSSSTKLNKNGWDVGKLYAFKMYISMAVANVYYKCI